MTKREVVQFLVAASESEHDSIIEAVAIVREMRAESAPKKPGPKPGSKRKPKTEAQDGATE